MPARSSRKKVVTRNQSNGKLFIQIIICIVIVCTFMTFKDVALPNGKTPKDYAAKILTTTVNFSDIISNFKDDISIPAGAEIIQP